VDPAGHPFGHSAEGVLADAAREPAATEPATAAEPATEPAGARLVADELLAAGIEVAAVRELQPTCTSQAPSAA
jgi:hypothetical protein